MHTVKMVVLLVISILVVVVIAQNTEVVTLRLLAWETKMSQIVLLSLVLVAGILIGFLAAKWPFRKKKSSP